MNKILQVIFGRNSFWNGPFHRDAAAEEAALNRAHAFLDAEAAAQAAHNYSEAA